MSGVSFTQNLAVDRGGAIYAVGFSSINILSKSTFLNNRAIGGVGGDLYASSSTTAAFNSSIKLNVNFLVSVNTNLLFRSVNPALAIFRCLFHIVCSVLTTFVPKIFTTIGEKRSKMI